jgi:hypothetical protein
MTFGWSRITDSEFCWRGLSGSKAQATRTHDSRSSTGTVASYVERCLPGLRRS